MNSIIFEVVWISFLACGFLTWHFSQKAKNDERRMLIERGLNPNDPDNTKKELKFPWLKIGLIVVGLSVGLLIIAILGNLNLLGRSDAIFPAILGLCGGSGLLISHFIEKRGK